MTAVLAWPSSFRHKLFLLIVGPLIVALAAALGGFGVGVRSADPAGLERQERRLTESFDALLAQAAAAADTALLSASTRAPRTVAAGPLTGRIEGIAILGPDANFLSWSGTPVEPPARFADPGWPRWSVRVHGVRTRLLVRSGPDVQGRFALLSIIVDSTLPDQAFRKLLPADLTRAAQLELVFRDTELHYGARAPSGREEDARVPVLPAPGARSVLLRSPSGQVLAAASLAPLATDLRVTRIRRAGRAWSTVLLILLLAVLFDWSRCAATARGLVLLAGVLLGARALLVWQQVPVMLLPRDLGTASVFGSSALWGLLDSPADLLLSAAALYLMSLGLRRFCTSLAVDRPATAVAVAAGFGSIVTLSALGLTVSLARNTRIPLLDRPAPFEWDARLLLWIGLVLALLAAAELLAPVRWLIRPREAEGAIAGRAAVAVAFVALAAASGVLLQQLTQRSALEQLSTDLAPQVLEQSLRRRVVLTDAMRGIHDRVMRDDPRALPLSSARDSMAYHYWVTSELFRSGFRSSLDFYTTRGDRIAHFGFDLPPLEEQIGFEGVEPGELTITREVFELPLAGQQRLLHAEMPVVRGGERLGIVVGHILDEPDNLPFLPWSQPHLAALGPGSPRAGKEFGGGLQYVLYDGFGAVVLTTLVQPPAESGELRGAAEHGETVRVTAGDEHYVGLALQQAGERLHLLLLPARSPLERLAAIVRLALLGLLVLGCITLLTRLPRAGGPLALVRALRRSFYRKLLVALLAGSVVPLIGLALFLRGYVERRADAALISSATQIVSTAQRVMRDYTAVQLESGEGVGLDDGILYWLRSVVGQQIHVYENGLLLASSKRELFSSGLLPRRLDGEVQEKLVQEGLPTLVVTTNIGPSEMPVAYAPVRLDDAEFGQRIVAVPLVLEQRQIAQATARVNEVILLATVALVGLLAVAAAVLARTVARPVRELVAATSRIAAGDYSARLEPRTEDELAELVRGFNAMGSALQQQRAVLESQRDYMETLLRHDTTGVISLDDAGRVVTVNPAACALLGGCEGRLAEGSDLLTALAGPEELQPLARALAPPPDPGERVEVDLERNGTARRYQMVRVELRGAAGGEVGTLILLDDVTDLMRSNQLAAWAEMASVIAHEIKNPLTPIQLSTEHLRRLLVDRKVLPSPEIEACLETVIKQVRNLYAIAGEFSAYAKLPALDLQPTDPVEFMRATLEPYRVAMPAGVVLLEHYEPTPPVAMDQRVLARAVINLVENALQAMPDGGELSIGVAHEEGNGTAVLYVGDTGPGLASTVRQRLFEPYFSTKSSGTGLGLPIARRAVEAHQGKIEVGSERERRTIFYIRLPVRGAE